MNSMNFISSLGLSNTRRNPSPPGADVASPSQEHQTDGSEEAFPMEHGTESIGDGYDVEQEDDFAANVSQQDNDNDDAYTHNEKTPLLPLESSSTGAIQSTDLFHRFSSAIISVLLSIVNALLAPGRSILSCFYNDRGESSVIHGVMRLSRKLFRPGKHDTLSPSSASDNSEKSRGPAARRRSEGEPPSRSVIPLSDRADLAPDDRRSHRFAQSLATDDSPSRHTRSKSLPGASSVIGPDNALAAPSKRSIRIKVVNDASLRRPRSADTSQPPPLTMATIKSPHGAGLDRYPRAPRPPRPLVPRRQPSSASPAMSAAQQKTLVLDLDETLIHSMAKGGRMSTGHMVEVKLSMPVGIDGGVLGPQVPILYYVHKRPHCDEFLRKVSKWYNLIVFTASVQEYADPVIDWLELERKYFSARYYRQHCTYRNGAYIKDLSTVEPDLSKVMILDNSPMSYIFHEDNAIPIEGWISDPSDRDLLNLVPLLEGLQYSTDVRALLALRLGESTAG